MQLARAPRPQLTATPGVERDPMRGFASLADFARDVRTAALPGGQITERLELSQRIGAAPSDFMKERHSSEGYAVPPAIEQAVRRNIDEQDDLLQLVAPRPTSSNSFQVLVNEDAPWGSDGVVVSWLDEGAALSPTKPGVESRQGLLHKVAAFVQASDELADDSPALKALNEQASAAAISWAASEAIMNGTGVGTPLGWRNSPALVTITKETGQAADSIVLANLTKAFARYHHRAGDRPIWLAHRSTAPMLEPLRAAWDGSLLGVPLRYSGHCKPVGDAGDVQLVDLAAYAAREKVGGIAFAESMHLFFDYAVTAFRWTFRIGGLPLLGAAVTPANGNDTLSSYVEIAARA